MSDVTPYVEPPQAAELDSIVARLADKATELTVTNETEAGHATNIIASLRTALTQAEAARKSLVKPLNDHVKFINGTFKPRTAQLEAAKDAASRALSAYVVAKEQEVERRRAEAEAAAEAERQRLQAEANAEAERRRTLARLEDRDPDWEEAPAPLPEVVPAYVAPPQTTRTVMGAVHARKTWAFEVTDIKALLRYESMYGSPPQFLIVNETAMRSYIRSMKDELATGRQPIPGVRFYQETGAVVRS